MLGKIDYKVYLIILRLKEKEEQIFNKNVQKYLFNLYVVFQDPY